MPQLGRDWGSSAVLRSRYSRHYKAIVVSDLHFPRKDSHPKYLYEFLQHNSCDTLILLGDTHEGYEPQLQEFQELNFRVWDMIAARKAQGMQVIDVAGNHDAYKRNASILDHKIFGTEYRNSLILDGHEGSTLLFHGDALDTKIVARYDKVAYKIAKKIAIGDKSLLDIANALEKIFSTLASKTSQKPNSLQTEFRAAALARGHGCRAVLMGHSHKASPFSPAANDPEILYGNTGAWVGHQATAMVLKHDNSWEFIDWRVKRETVFSKKPEGLSGPHPYAAYRDGSVADFKWQKAQHHLYVQEGVMRETQKTLDNVNKVRRKVQNLLKKTEERLAGTRQEIEQMNAHAGIERLPKPFTRMLV